MSRVRGERVTCGSSASLLGEKRGFANNLAPVPRASAAERSEAWAEVVHTSFLPLQERRWLQSRATVLEGLPPSYSGSHSTLAEQGGGPLVHRPVLAGFLSRSPGHFSAWRPAAVTLSGTEGGGAASFLSGRGAQSRWLGQAARSAGSALAAPFRPARAHARPKGRANTVGVQDPARPRPLRSFSGVRQSICTQQGQTDQSPGKVRVALRPQSSEIPAVPFSLDTQKQIQTRRNGHLSGSARAQPPPPRQEQRP